MSILQTHAVKELGLRDGRPLVFVHGFGCDQNMWRFITPEFESDCRVILYDLMGSGASQLALYDREKYATLNGHAADLVEICETLGLEDAVLVGHSVSAMIAALAANRARDRVGGLAMVGPSPCYINDGDYVGGFEREDIEGLLQTLEANYLGWSSQMAPAIMGLSNPDELGQELTDSFCRNDPDIASHFARVTFFADHRDDMRDIVQPTLILQCSDDIIAPLDVGTWLDGRIADSDLVVMQATGHCPHMSAPAETSAAIRRFLDAPR